MYFKIHVNKQKVRVVTQMLKVVILGNELMDDFFL